MQFGSESLLPPLVAILFAIATRRVVIPLACGVFVGAVLLAVRDDQLAWWHAPQVFFDAMWTSAITTSHLQAVAFTLLLGAMVGVLERGGGMRSLIRLLSRKIKSRRGAQSMIASSGLAIFFDDYANTLLLGGTMRSTADRYGLSREKLAYLVDSTAAPVAGLAVVSTWAAIEISYMGDGLKAGGVTEKSAAFDLFIRSIPYRFYPWLALVMVYCISWTGRDFGPMRQVEQAAHNGRANALQSEPSESLDHRWLWVAAVVPVLLCLAAVAWVLVHTGLQAVGDWRQIEGGPLRVAGQILGNGDAYVALIVGGLLGLIAAIVMALGLGDLPLRGILRSAWGGAKQMVPALVILWFAWALSAMTEPDRLDTGGYLAGLLSDRLDPRLLPTVVFLTAGAMAFSTGTSWGTMGILTPLSIALALRLDPTGGPDGAIVLSTSGAVLAGAIFGDHCSPISDTTVLSSRASDCDHVAHVRTQMPYAIVVAVICIIAGTLPSTLGVSPWISLIVGLVAIVASVRVLGSAPESITSETGSD
jgi:Na+/H+ antiporter NhaC